MTAFSFFKNNCYQLKQIIKFFSINFFKKNCIFELFRLFLKKKNYDKIIFVLFSFDITSKL